MKNEISRAIALAIDKLTYLRHIDVWVSASRSEDLIQYSRSLGKDYFPYQVSPGRLFGSVFTIKWGSITVFFESTSRDVIFYDPNPPGMLSVCMSKGEGGSDLNFAGRDMLIRRVANCESVSVSVPDKLDFNSFPNLKPARPNFFSEAAMWSASKSVRHLVIDQYGDEFEGVRQMRMASLPLMAILNNFYCKLECYVGPRRPRVICVIYKFLEEAQRSSSQRIDDLAEDLNMSRRNLQYYTTEVLGIGPKKLVKCQKLRNIMRSIPSAVVNGKGIGDLAYEHGFEHFSQFCADYRSMFGERPTDTLRRHSLLLECN